jgi:hypothetical protein
MNDFLDKLLNPTEVEKLGKTGCASVLALTELAESGNQSAADELVTIAYGAAIELTSLCKTKPELFEKRARKGFDWPMLHSLHGDSVKENDTILKNLKLGADSGINISGNRRRFSFEPPANKIAIELHFVACSLRRASMEEWKMQDWLKLWWTSHLWEGDARLRPLEKWAREGPGRALPPLSKGTAKLWKNAVPSLFRLVYGAKFDEHPQLQELRRSVFNSAKDNYDRVGGAGVVRKRMLQAVKQSFGVIAAPCASSTR